MPRMRTQKQANADSIISIPVDQLPDVGARAALVEMALKGEEVYAYTPACSDQYVVYIYTTPWDECRHNPAEWAREWRSKVAV